MFTRRNRAAVTAALALAAALALTGCTINLGDPGDAGDRGIGDHGPGQGPMGGGYSDSDEFSPSDIMFAQMMIPHHQQAVDMSDLALERSTDPDVVELAQQIRDAQAPEIEQMEDWLDAVGAGTSMGHSPSDMGMGMGGMLGEEDMEALENATGSEFDRLYLEGMIEHHEGAIEMTRMIRDSGNDEVRALAEAIVESQTAEIERMEEMLAG
ncbi:DUF305 domain-containing protein [Agromyces sp. H66]|uniref:DUF305 domain-containing protein n=1 Tax=Agromyces sp. H66 TaxID=2529859 RepID=UPI0010AAC940|nr:DUF305 domain-containing protein [Agromyces sp. H66]